MMSGRDKVFERWERLGCMGVAREDKVWAKSILGRRAEGQRP